MKFWGRGGNTDLDNLIMLCGTCHRALHDGQFTITALGEQSSSSFTPMVTSSTQHHRPRDSLMAYCAETYPTTRSSQDGTASPFTSITRSASSSTVGPPEETLV
ncbi:HNH endonuclease signature motif containing protein [Rhodococcus sp. 3Y1]